MLYWNVYDWLLGYRSSEPNCTGDTDWETVWGWLDKKTVEPAWVGCKRNLLSQRNGRSQLSRLLAHLSEQTFDETHIEALF